MNFDAIRAELDQEMAWRVEEIKFFQNQGNLLNEEQKNRYRRALILILYSHFEGFCKFAFLHYVQILNRSGVRCRDANYALAAATLALAFHGLRDTQKKNPFYGRQLPDDPVLHRYAREREFMERMDDFTASVLRIPDEVVDTESNLKPNVLKATLYKLGLDPSQFEDIYSDVGQLVGLRNNIAHGATKKGIDQKLYDVYERAAFRVMTKVAEDIMEALKNSSYLRAR
jgi:hypothetical protein